MTSKFDNKYQDILNESGLHRIWSKTQNSTCGTITAFRGDQPYEVNKQNNKKILAYLLNKGYSVTKIQGTYIENYKKPEERHVSEQSFFVENSMVEGDDNGQLKNDLARLAETYNQDSILMIPVGGENAYLYGTSKNEDMTPAYHQSLVVGDGKYGKHASEFISKIKGREFAFESVKLPQTINGLRGNSILLKQIEKDMSDL